MLRVGNVDVSFRVDRRTSGCAVVHEELDMLGAFAVRQVAIIQILRFDGRHGSGAGLVVERSAVRRDLQLIGMKEDRLAFG